MIEINLLPDVKRELLRAVRVRNTVVSISIIASIVAVGILVALLLFMGGQEVVDRVTTDNIKKESQKLSKVEAISNAVTIQNQLTKINELHDSKVISSRLFDMLVTINPPEPNTIAISNLTVNTAERRVEIEAQAEGGYGALETFRKTILATNVEYIENGQPGSQPLASELTDGDRSFGNNAENKKVLTFKLSFTYSEFLTSNKVTSLTIAGPERRNATDSYIGVPSTLFVEAATQSEEGEDQ